MHLRAFVTIPIVLVGWLSLGGAPVAAQCGTWHPGFAALGLDREVREWVEFDDGTGPAVFAISGSSSASGQLAQGVLRWKGTTWSQVGSGLYHVGALALYDDGSGVQLYAGGAFDTGAGAPANRIARWNGTNWSPLAALGASLTSGNVEDLAVADLGVGPELLVAGTDLQVAGLPGFHGVLRWTTAGWTPTGTIVGGAFRVLGRQTPAGSEIFATTPSSVLRFAGGAWSTIGSNPSSSVTDLALFDDGLGGGEQLFACGLIPDFAGVVLNGIGRWDGATWSALPGSTGIGLGIDGVGAALEVFDDGTGSALYLGGQFETAGGQPIASLARWNGTSWSAVAPVPTAADGPGPASIASVAWVDDGGGKALFVGGKLGVGITSAGGETGLGRCARWRANGWSALGTGLGLVGPAHDACTFDDGTGNALYVCGAFRAAGELAVGGIGRWNGSAWTAVGNGTGADGTVRGLAVLDSGAGPELFALGEFRTLDGVVANGLARWNGTSWSSVGGGVDGVLDDALVHDDGTGPAIYVCGQFSLAGSTPANHVARWNGSAWSSLGTGTNGEVRKLVALDFGAGNELVLLGSFTAAGGLPTRNSVRWNGTAFAALPGITLAGARDLFVLDTMSGREVFLLHTTPTGSSVQVSIARYSGGVATAMVPPISDDVSTMTALDFGSGPVPCVVIPWFASLRLRSLVGTTWTEFGVLDERFDGQSIGPFGDLVVRNIAAFDGNGDGVRELYAVGSFTHAVGGSSANIARFEPCGTVGEVVCAGDGSAGACPCGNSGAPGHGCANSVHAAGGELASGGLASLALDTLRLEARDLPNSTALFFQGTSVQNGGAGVVFGDGLLCPGGTLVRLGVRAVAGGTTSTPPAGGPSLSQRGGITQPGSTRVYQAQYRNAASFCTSATVNGTNALSITWSL